MWTFPLLLWLPAKAQLSALEHYLFAPTSTQTRSLVRIKPEDQGPSPRTTASSKWSSLDRRLLYDHVEKHGAGNWSAAAAAVPSKTAKQCRDHWIKTLSPLLRKTCENV